MAPHLLAKVLHSLPPILHMSCQNPISCCSKGPRGLSVPPRERGVCTTTTISPSPSLRQCPSRYAIHARHQLDDKEFRYLRTLIVRAALHRSLGWELFPLEDGITPFLDFTASSTRQSVYVGFSPLHRPVFLVNSRPGLFAAARLDPACAGLRRAVHIPKLRTHFAEFLNDGSLERLRILSSPTSVGFGTGASSPCLALFSAVDSATTGQCALLTMSI